jgi:uncharacterized protein (DUF885 family)
MLRSILAAFLLSSLLVSSLDASQRTPNAPTPSEGEKLHQLINEEWEWKLRDNPGLASEIGDRRYNDRWSDLSAEAIERRRAHQRELVTRIGQIDRSRLTAEDQLNYDLFLYAARLDVEGQRFPSELIQITPMGGIHTLVPSIAQIVPRQTVKDHDDYIARLRAMPQLIDQSIALMRQGLERGIVPPRITLRNVSQVIANQITDDPRTTPVFSLVFTSMPANIPAVEQERLRASATDAVETAVLPALRKLATFWNEEYYPAARQTTALSDLPDGEAWYEFQVRQMTTTPLTAREIHQIGLSEVARIRAEMESIRSATGFEGSLEEFFTFLRTDPRFFFTEREELVAAYRNIAKQIDPELPKLFGRLPRLPYGVVAVPEYDEKSQTTAYYFPGAASIGRAGYFYANTYDLPSRPKWEMEALTIHEAVPGHHLQIALAQELENVPAFRRDYGGYTAFVEGWGLYSESLGPELGMYRDPYSKFGQLTYEMWRAIRLVVDTGLHAKGWSRQQAIDYFRANAGKSEHDITVEIDRYIVWPGQALAYKIGELTIKRLRAEAERELGDAFDIRGFHDTVLGAGPLPMETLEQRVRGWIAEQKAAAKAS